MFNVCNIIKHLLYYKVEWVTSLKSYQRFIIWPLMCFLKQQCCNEHIGIASLSFQLFLGTRTTMHTLSKLLDLRSITLRNFLTDWSVTFAFDFTYHSVTFPVTNKWNCQCDRKCAQFAQKIVKILLVDFRTCTG